MPSSLLALLDDIATTLDDVAAMTKVAAKKTAGVLGDDLALNAEQVSGASAERELPIVWAVAKGSIVNKMILIPAALLTSAIAPWAVLPLLMLGGAYLCYEGVEKLAHAFVRRRHAASDLSQTVGAGPPSAKSAEERHAIEAQKVRGAIRTDFVLSAEIIVISLGSVASASFGQRAATLYSVGLIMTVGVYGFVALIVKADDFGGHLARKAPGWRATFGMWLVRAAPAVMRSLSVLGTAAMFLVGGSLLIHGVPRLHHGCSALAERAGWLSWLVSWILEALVAIAAGGAILVIVTVIRRLQRKPKR